MIINKKDVSVDLFKNKCRENNLKVTPQRVIIYQELFKSHDHPSAEIIYQRVRKILEDISFDTVNRTLLTLAKIGIIHIVEGYGEARRFDPHLNQHHHFRCINCGSIIDFNYKPYDKLAIPPSIKKRFKTLSKKVLLEGYCPECLENK